MAATKTSSTGSKGDSAQTQAARSKRSDTPGGPTAPSGVIQGGREVTERERLTGVSRRPDDPLEFSAGHQKLNDKFAKLVDDITDLREEAYNAGNSVLAQIIKGVEREAKVSALGYVRFKEEDADQRPDEDTDTRTEDKKGDGA